MVVINFQGSKLVLTKTTSFRRCLSPRLQRRAPCPLQVKPIASFKSMGMSITSNSSSSAAATSSPTSSLNTFYHTSKDPIPLLSPLVLPSLLESVCNIQQENATKSHWINNLSVKKKTIWALFHYMYCIFVLCINLSTFYFTSFGLLLQSPYFYFFVLIINTIFFLHIFHD